ncbi:LLM class flavin-dependent oxidoreductase [Streptomyces diastatochromogenes]|uniref:LLM class flavin-dependent oxidoreductase n=1 Tax=Streptomyces diastatochromogenes TaxID=42236 RepID=UPI00364F7C14
MHVDYDDILRVWLEADEISEIEHAWLWDHMLPLAGPKDGKIYEGWTLLAALAAQTRRLRLGLLVTSNRIRRPAVLGKIATTAESPVTTRPSPSTRRTGSPWCRRARASSGWRRPSRSSSGCGPRRSSTSRAATTR